MPPYDPNKDPALKGKSSPLTTEQQVSAIDVQVAEAKRQGKMKAKKQARKANLSAAERLGTPDSELLPLGILSAVPATIAAATTPDDYLVGRQGSGEAPKRVGDMSLFDQILGEDQLSLADPLKALVFKDKKDLQQKYLAGEADTGTNVTMKILEAVGLAGDIVMDPLNLIGGIGVADDAFAGLAKGAKLEASAAKLAERAAVDGADSWAAKGAKLLDDHHALLDSIDGQLAAGAVDDITAAGLKEEAANAFRETFGELNGQALLAGDTVLAESRFLPGKLIHEAGFGAKSRASLITERATELQKDIAKAVGSGLNPMETGSSLRLPVFGGRTADELVTDAWTKGFGGLSEDARKAMGITGRIHRFNKADLLSGRAFNPFASSASATMDGGFLMNTPGAFIRSNSIKGGTNLVEKGADLLRPTMGRASKIWRAAFEISDGGQEAAERALTRLRKTLGPDALRKTSASDAAVKVEDQLLNYPLTVMNEARLDGLIRAGGKRLAVAGAKTQQEIGSRLLQETEQDATKWTLRGSDDVVTPVWSRVQQSNFEAVDSAISGAGGSLKTSLAEALRDSMVRLDIPLNLDEVLPGESISKISAEVFSRVINDSEFADDIGRIFQQNMRRMAEKDVSKGDLLRATLNALSTAATISKETSGVFDWVEAMTRVGAAKELFSSSGAEALGREAKLFSYMEDMGLAVLYRAEQGELSTDEIHALINQLADDYTGVAVRYTDTFDRVLEAKAELRRGLKLRGVTEEKIVQIEDDIAQNVMDRDGMAAVLDEARAAADEARGDLQVTGDVLREQQSALRDIERTVQKLEETHLALLGYRDLETQLKSKLTELERAAMAVDLVTVDVRPFIERLDQLTTTDFLSDTFPTGGSPWLGVPQQRDPRPAFLLNQALADTPKGISAGVRQQQFNRSLRLAREMFGDSVDLDQLAKHGALAAPQTEGFGMTEGALNTATIARFFEQSADPRVTEAANKFGGWETLLRTQDEAQISEVKRVAANLATRRENQIARDMARQASGEFMVIAPKLTRYGVTGQALTEFMLNTMADRVEAITPLVDEMVDALSVGPIERIEALFAGNEKGLDVARQMMSGDFSHLNALVTELARGLDIAIGVPGGFGDAGTFQLMRELIMADPRKYAIFTRAKEVFEGIENASLLTHAAADATETHVYLTDEIDAILGVMPNGRILENRRADLIDSVMGAPDMGQLADEVAVTAEQRAQIREVLKEASKRVRSTRSRIETMGRQSEKWRVALDEKLTDLNVIDGWIYNYQQLVDDQMSTVAMFDQQLQREAAVISGTPVIANILGASADVRVVKNGFIEFAQDPKVSFKTLADGSVVRRSDDEIMALWDRRIEGAAKWTDTLRERAVNGYMTKGGREVPAINRYAYAKGLEKEWMLARAEEGFSGVWHHAALADGGGAGAMIALATNYPRRNGNEAVAAWEMLTSMLKAGYVGTPAFSVRNLTGALIENIRQGINPLVSKKVWATDSVARGLEGMISFVNTIEEEAVAKEYRKLIREAQDAVEKHFGSDVYGSVVEARHVGVTDSIFQFQEISGMAPGEEGTNTFRGMLRSWGKAIRDTRHVARRETEARFGDEPLLRSLAGITGAVQAVPTHPARYFEQALAGAIELRARGKVWKQVFSDPEMAKKVADLEKLAEPFTARPGVEALVRVDLYAQRRLAGDSTEMAFNRMMASHFDYTDLSSADEAMKTIMPFWIWRSRSMVHYAEMLSAKPSTLGHTFRIWEDQHRSKDPRAPRYTTEVGGGFDPASFLGLAVPDPAADVIGLKDQVTRGWGESGVLGALTEPAKQVVANDLVTLVSVPSTAFSGYTSEGIPIDTPASIQGPLSVIASAPGGSAVVEKFAYRGKGDKWYWRYPGASYVFGEILPMLSNVVKITQPVEDGDGIAEKTFGAIARFFGTPVRLVPAAEQERSRRATMIRRRIAAQEQQKRGG